MGWSLRGLLRIKVTESTCERVPARLNDLRLCLLLQLVVKLFLGWQGDHPNDEHPQTKLQRPHKLARRGLMITGISGYNKAYCPARMMAVASFRISSSRWTVIGRRSLSSVRSSSLESSGTGIRRPATSSLSASCLGWMGLRHKWRGGGLSY